MHGLFELLPVAVARLATDGRLADANEALARLVGRRREDLRRMGSEALFDGDSLERLREALAADTLDARFGPLDLSLTRRDGLFVPVRVRGTRTGSGGGPEAWAVLEDRTDVDTLEERLRRDLELSSALDRIGVEILGSHDVRVAMDAVLDSLIELFDCDRASLVRVPGEDEDRIAAEFERFRPGFPGTLALGTSVAAGAELRATTERLLAGEGALTSPVGELDVPPEITERFQVHAALAVAIQPFRGDPWLLILTHCRGPRSWSARDRELANAVSRRLGDVLALLLAEEQRHETEARYRTLIEHAPEALVVYDLEAGRMVDTNQRACELFGMEREDLLCMTPDALSPARQADGSDSAEAVERLLRATIEEGPRVFEWLHEDSGGHTIPCEVRLVRLPGPRPQVRGSIIDIRERKRLEEELRQSQKMEAVGSLAGGIAHDFNNLLVAILGNVELVDGLLPEDSSLREPIGEVRRAGERAASLTNQLLAFSRKQSSTPVVLDLNENVRGVLRMVGRLLGDDVLLVTRIAPHPLWIRADPVHVEQVLLNLCTNARDAMPGGGTLTVATSAESKGRVSLSVRDDGVGMNDEVAARALEPFFTTKEVGKGTGLGLSTVYGIVTQSGGELTIDSRPGVGTTVRASFPTVPAPAPERTEEDGAGADPAGPERATRVLLVEDDPSVAAVVRRTLRTNGYSVLSARDGREAIELASTGEPFDVLLTDVVMPRMGGPELARHLRRSRPDLPVLFCTGHSPDSLAPDSGHEVLRKPFRSSELLAALRRVIDA